MTGQLNARPTMLFWFISGAALIWNLFGMMIYVSQVSATPEQLAEAYRPEQVEFLLGTPKWATAAFALAVTTGVLGCVLPSSTRPAAGPPAPPGRGPPLPAWSAPT